MVVAEKPAPAIQTEEDAVRFLLNFLKPGQLIRLAELLQRCRMETGYGGIEIVMADRVVQTFKLVQSYK